MQLASFLAGIAMSKTKTAICHSISYPLTSLYGLSYGIACSLTLSEVCKLNVKHNPQRASIIRMQLKNLFQAMMFKYEFRKQFN